MTMMTYCGASLCAQLWPDFLVYVIAKDKIVMSSVQNQKNWWHGMLYGQP